MTPVLSRPSRTGGVVRAAAGLGAVAAFAAGMPWLLTHLFGSPWAYVPSSITELLAVLQRPMDDRWLIGMLVGVVWVCWGIGVYALLAEALAQATGRRVRLPAPRPARAVAAALLGAIGLLILSALRPTPGHAAVVPSGAGLHAPQRPHNGDQGARGATRVYRVRPGDSLWAIADHKLGTSRRWGELWRLNQGHRQSDGHRLRAPELIMPGWRIQLPSHPDAHRTGHAPGEHRRASRPDTRPSTSTRVTPARTAEPSARASTQRCGPPAPENGAAEALPSLSALVAGIGAGVLGGWACRRGSPLTSLKPLRLARGRKVAAQPAVPTGGPEPDEVRETEAPGHIVVAERDGVPIGIDVLAVGGVGIDGPAAEDVLRAVVFRQLLSNGGPQTGATEFWTYRELAARLLADTDVDTITGLRIVETPDDLARLLEIENIDRARAANDEPESDGAVAGPLPPLVVLADTETVDTVAGPVGAGREYNVTALVTVAWPDGLTCQTGQEGRITHVTGYVDEVLVGAQLRTLSREDAAQLQLLVPREDHPQDQTDDAPPQDAEAEVSTGGEAQVKSTDEETARPSTGELEIPDETRPVQIRVLGPVTIEAAGTELVTGLRRDSRDLLGYLALHPDGSRTEQIYADLWPELDPADNAEKLRSAVRTVRAVVRKATGARNAMFVLHAAGRYRLDQTLIGVDLRRFQAAVTSATTATDDDQRRTWLEHAAALYAGEAFAGCDHLFAEEIREAERRRILTVLARLADLTEHDNPDIAINHLDRACDLDPYNSHLYDRILAIQQRMGRLDAAERTRRLRDARMNELDAEE